MSGRERSAERAEFLSDLLVTAIEHYDYGFPAVHEWVWDVPPAQMYAVISDRYEEGAEADVRYRVDIEVMARGLGVIRRAKLATVEDFDGPAEVLHNAATGQRLYLSQPARRDLLQAERTNGEEGDIDVIGALAVLECALFGAVVYG